MLEFEELKPAVKDTLRAIVMGRAIVSINHKANDGYIEEWDGQKIRDPDHPDRKMLMPGVWTLFENGFIDEFAVPTEKTMNLSPRVFLE